MNLYASNKLPVPEPCWVKVVGNKYGFATLQNLSDVVETTQK